MFIVLGTYKVGIVKIRESETMDEKNTIIC